MPPRNDRNAALAELLTLSERMAGEGRTLIERVLPTPPAAYTQYTHYPKGDAIDPVSGARWFYHAHKPEERGEDEHGHFHLFLPKSAFGDAPALAAPDKDDAAKVVHVAALCFATDGLPTHWIATAQHVTKEHLYPADAIIARLDQLDLRGAGLAQGIADVGTWLTLAMQLARTDIGAMLQRRDMALGDAAKRDILARQPFRL